MLSLDCESCYVLVGRVGSVTLKTQGRGIMEAKSFIGYVQAHPGKFLLGGVKGSPLKPEIARQPR